MKRIYSLIILSLISYFAKAQITCDLSYGTDSTLEIVTWNIENFPKNSSYTVDYVSQIITNLDVDILALQEIADVDAFNQVLINTGLSGHTTNNSYKDLAFIYNPEVITNVTFSEILSGYSCFTSNPMQMNFTYSGKDYVLIDVHLKCCGDGILDLSDSYDEETRRYNSCNIIKSYIEDNYPNANVIVVGDMNDILTDDYNNNVFRNLLDDSTDYRFADMEIATGSYSNWSYPSPGYIQYRSQIDHILITNELFDEFENTGSRTKTIKLDSCFTGGWDSYDYNISDHRPVALKMNQNINVNVNENLENTVNFEIRPNPVSDKLNFYFNVNNSNGCYIEIYNVEGQKVKTINVKKGQTNASLSLEAFNAGIYIARFVSKTAVMQKKFVVEK